MESRTTIYPRAYPCRECGFVYGVHSYNCPVAVARRAAVLIDNDNLDRFAPGSTHPDKLTLDAIMSVVHGHRMEIPRDCIAIKNE